MVITVLEAKVREQFWPKLKEVYSQKTAEVPPEIISSYLLQNTNDKEVWQIVTIWRSMEDLQAMRQSGQTPTGVLIFQSANATPKLSIYAVEAQAAS